MLITDNQTLKLYCEKAIKEDVIAFDTEFMRDKTYYPKLSLVQVATNTDVFAVDMLSGLDYSPLSNFLAKEDILKVIHSSRQDVELIYNFFGFIPKNLFDTQIAAIFLGYKDSPSFETLVGAFLEKKICKKLQFSNWLIRPLSEKQLAYAIDDANLLYHLYFKIKDKLEEFGRFNWVIEESNIIDSGEKFKVTLDNILSKFTNHIHKEKDLIKCLKIISWREEKAKELDIPRTHLMKDEAVIQLCLAKANSVDKVLTSSIMRNINEENAASIASILLEETLESESDMVKAILNSRRVSCLQKNNLFYLLKILLELISKKSHINESFIANTADLLQVANGLNSRISKGWRKEVFGEIVDKFLHGQLSLSHKDNEFIIS